MKAFLQYAETHPNKTSIGILIAVAVFIGICLWEDAARRKRHLQSLKSQADQGRDMMPRDQKTFLNQ